VVDGAVVDGAVVDGAVVDGAVVDGAVVDGAVADGAVVDGAVADGAVADGAAEEAIAPIAPSNPIAQGVTEAPTAGGAGTTNPNYRNLTFQELEQKIFRGQKWFTWE
jgi:hypothetical protein